MSLLKWILPDWELRKYWERVKSFLWSIVLPEPDANIVVPDEDERKSFEEFHQSIKEKRRKKDRGIWKTPKI